MIQINYIRVGNDDPPKDKPTLSKTHHDDVQWYQWNPSTFTKYPKEGDSVRGNQLSLDLSVNTLTKEIFQNRDTIPDEDILVGIEAVEKLLTALKSTYGSALGDGFQHLSHAHEHVRQTRDLKQKEVDLGG